MLWRVMTAVAGVASGGNDDGAQGYAVVAGSGGDAITHPF